MYFSSGQTLWQSRNHQWLHPQVVAGSVSQDLWPQGQKEPGAQDGDGGGSAQSAWHGAGMAMRTGAHSLMEIFPSAPGAVAEAVSCSPL